MVIFLAQVKAKVQSLIGAGDAEDPGDADDPPAAKVPGTDDKFRKFRKEQAENISCRDANG